jgi:hemerythrin-like domain-containing protein
MPPISKILTESLNNIRTEADRLYQQNTPDYYKKFAEQGPIQAGFVKAPAIIKAGFDEIDTLLGTTAHSIMKSVAEGNPTYEKGSFMEDAGSLGAMIGGERVRPFAEFGGAIFLPPFGVGGTTKAVTYLNKAERALIKGENLAKFSERASKTVRPEAVTKIAEDAFPGISKTLAEDLGKRYAKVVDPGQITTDVEKIVKTGMVAPSKYATTLSEAVPKIADDIQAQHIRKADSDLFAQVQKVLNEGVDAATKASERMDDVGVAVGQELIKRFTREADELLAKGDKVGSDLKLDTAVQIAKSGINNLTEAGRTVRAASLIKELTPEGIIRFASKTVEDFNKNARAKGILGKKELPPLTADQARFFSGEMRRIQTIEDPLQKVMAQQKLYDKIGELIPTPLWKKVTTLYRAGLLTGLTTTGLNLASNAANFVAEIVKDTPATLVDSMVTFMRRLAGDKAAQRTLSFSMRGIPKGTREGMEKGWQYLKTGFDERGMDKKMDIMSKVNFGTSPIAKTLQGYEEFVFRTMGTADQPFYYAAKARSLWNQAITQARNEGLMGSARMKRAEEIVGNPTDDMLKYSMEDAKTAVFQNETALGNLASLIQRNTGPVGELIIPFARTPGAVATAMVNYSPVGIVKEIATQIYRGKFDQRLFSQAMGRGVTGTGLWYLGKQLWDSGRISLGYPTKEKEQKQWELEGRVPNSIKIGDTWRTLNVLGPAGLNLALGGYLANGLKETGSPTEAAVQAVTGMGQLLTEQSFFQGFKRFTDALKDAETFGQAFVSGIIGGFMPSLIAAGTRATDKYERRAEGLLGQLQSRTPIWRQQLEPQVNVLGEKKETPGFLTVMLDPTRPKTPSDSPAVKELQRLWEAGQRPTPTQLGSKTGFKTLDPDQNTRMWVLAGDRLHEKLLKLFDKPAYQALSDESKAKKIGEFAEQAGIEARAAIVLEVTKGLTGQELKDKLKEFKADKVLTEDVFKEFMRLRRGN